VSDSSAGDRRRWTRAAASPLLVVWLLVIAVIAAGSAYIFMDDAPAPPPGKQTPTSTTAVVLPLPALPAKEAAVPPAAEEEASDAGLPTTAAPLPAWRRHAAAFEAPDDDRPLVAVVVTGLGLAKSTTQTAIEQLPAEVTLSFSAYAADARESMALARGRGHEVMLDLPMEPDGVAGDDPGPLALLSALDDAENRARLQTILGRAEGYVGLVGAMGARFLADRQRAQRLLQDLADRGLIFLDNGAAQDDLQTLVTGLDLAYLRGDGMVDADLVGAATIDARLARVERLALARGGAVVLCGALPTCLARLQAWSAELADRGLVLAPISALVKRRAAP
jgi:polysaccharide deacetylase 2 family uncharacterized protein YibQ